MQATLDGGKTFVSETLTMPGKRPSLNQGDRFRDVFYAHDIENPIVYELDMTGGRDGVSFDNSPSARVSGVNTVNAGRRGFSFIRSADVYLNNSAASFVGEAFVPGDREGVYLEDSIGAEISQLVVNTLSTNQRNFYKFGIHVLRSDDAVIKNGVFVFGAISGIEIQGSHNAHLDLVTLDDVGTGIRLQNSNNAFLKDVTITHSTSAIYVEDSDQATLLNTSIFDFATGVTLDKANGARIYSMSILDGFNGIGVQHSDYVSLENIYTSDVDDVFLISSSDHILLSDIIMEQAYDVGINIYGSNDAKLSNISISDFNRQGLKLNKSNSISLDNITLKGTSAAGSAGITLVDSGKVGQEVSLSNVLVREADYGYQFDKDSAVKDLRFNVALFVNHICDEVDDATGSILVNGLTKCR